jgi:hypothetical protein
MRIPMITIAHSFFQIQNINLAIHPIGPPAVPLPEVHPLMVPMITENAIIAIMGIKSSMTNLLSHLL